MRFNEFNFFAHVKHEEVITTFWAWVLQCVNASSEEHRSVSNAAIRLLRSIFPEFATERVKVHTQFVIPDPTNGRKRIELDIVVENDRIGRGRRNQAIVIETKLGTPWTEGRLADEFLTQLHRQTNAIAHSNDFVSVESRRVVLVSNFTEMLSDALDSDWRVIGIHELLEALGSEADDVTHPLVREHRDWLTSVRQNGKGEMSFDGRCGQYWFAVELRKRLEHEVGQFQIRQGLNVQGNIGPYTKVAWNGNRIDLAPKVWLDHVWFRLEAVGPGRGRLKVQEYSAKTSGKDHRIRELWDLWDSSASQGDLPPQDRHGWNRRVKEPRLAEYRVETDADRRGILERLPTVWKLFVSSAA